MPRYFTLQQAELVLPHVDAAVRTALGLKAELQRSQDALTEISRKIMASGGMAVDQGAVSALRETRDRSAERLQQAVNEIHEFGCQVKDLDIGLLDFPTLYHGREVCLCWRLGEQRIEYWHGTEEGFPGRKPIDAEFLANHRGDALA